MSYTYTEWGVLGPDGDIEEFPHERDARHIAQMYGLAGTAHTYGTADCCGQVVRRTVTVEPWEPAP